VTAVAVVWKRAVDSIHVSEACFGIHIRSDI
jgi:hypothetical protein